MVYLLAQATDATSLLLPYIVSGFLLALQHLSSEIIRTIRLPRGRGAYSTVILRPTGTRPVTPKFRPSTHLLSYQ